MENQKSGLEDVVEYWTDLFEGLGQEGRRLFARTVRLVAKGLPVSLDQVAKAVQVPLDRVRSTLGGLGAEFDEKGNVVGLGLSLTPTPHRVRLATTNAPLYAWCGPDTLVFPAILKQTTRVESEDPLTGEKIRLTVGPKGVTELKPSGAVVSLVREVDACDIRGSVCNYQHFFASRETAEEYASRSKGMIILSVEEMYRVLRRVLEPLKDLF